MAKSKAQKQRAHLMRNGHRNPSISRNTESFSLHVRKNPTLHEKRIKQKTKHKHRQLNYC